MTPEERKELISEIVEVIQTMQPQLSEQEQTWVRMAIQKEATTLEFRKAIIEKTISSLIWSAIVGLGYLLLDFLRNHGLKI